MIDGLPTSGLGQVGAHPSDPRWAHVAAGELGPVRTAYADVLEEPEGVGFVVQLEPADEAVTAMFVRVVGPERAPVGGVAPFADATGAFAVQAPITDSQGAFFVPWAALQAAPATVHVLVAFATPTALVGHTAFDLEVKPESGPLTLAAYIRPVAFMALAVADADGVVDEAERGAIRVQLQTLFGVSDDQQAEIDEVLTGALPSLRRLAVSAWCRFPALDVEELFYALIGVANAGGAVTEAELDVVASVARHLEVPERTWRRWAYKLGVELPSQGSEPVPRRREVARTMGRRLVPSIILRLDPKGQDRRNPAASWSMMAGLVAVGLMVLGFLAAATPVASWLAVILFPTQVLLSLVALGSGWYAWGKAKELDGAGQGAAVTGLSLGVVFVVVYGVLGVAVCLGFGANVVLEQMYEL